MATPVVTEVDRMRSAQLVREDADATLAELRERLGIPCAPSTICQALKQLNLSFEKSRSTPPNRINRMWSNDGILGVRGLAAQISVV